jgi:UDP-GlcNAc3NAcA epimerase
MRLCIVVGARPNFIKAAPLVTAIKKYQKKHKDLSFFILHTGQHFDVNMSDVFFNEMGIPMPEFQLNIDSGTTHGKQTGEMLIKVEEVLMNQQPDMVISVGDTNSTLAGALAAGKLNIPIAHVEAGLRMYNKNLAEDVNRVVTDHMSTLLFPPSDVGKKNLLREGFPKQAVWQYGCVMYDALRQFEKIAEKTSKVFKESGLKKKEFVLVTMHRIENTFSVERARIILDALVTIAKDIKVILPLHPRTRNMLKEHDLFDYYAEHLMIIDPIGFLDMLVLEKNAKLVVTDSGGVQKEAFFQRTPCVFLFDDKTSWTELVELGWLTEVVPKSKDYVVKQIKKALSAKPGKKGNPYGKGNASELIIGKIISHLKKKK